MAPSISSSTNYGQVIEYIENRLYLASYTHAPNENTPFPYPADTRKSPSKRTARTHRPQAVDPSRPQPVYFTIDDTLLYNAFHGDFGPLHIGHLYRFAVIFHEILGDQANNDRAVVFWSRADSRSRANAACLVACYMVMIQNWPPHLALAPIAQADPPYMPFRDAGYSQADFMLSIQDVVYGVWKAKEEGLCELKTFNLEDYERFERVDQGDFNWVSPNFLAFASPQSEQIQPVPVTSPGYSSFPSTLSEIPSANISQPFQNVLTHFVEKSIGLVVRLNSELYCPTYFTALGVQHIDMIFEDGTCPALPIVRKFIKLADSQIKRGKGIAVHCKAGLGRTGCLIGAHLIYRHGFTANEVIAFMRFMRPGMVVGPQQHWLHLHQGTFRQWWIEDQFKAKLAAEQKLSTPIKTSRPRANRMMSTGQITTPPSKTSTRAALGEIDGNDSYTNAASNDENLPAPTPGQPRKYARMDARHHPYARSTSGVMQSPERSPERTTTEIVTMTSKDRTSGGAADSEEELILQRMAARRSQSKSPVHSAHKGRSVSHTITTTTETVSIFEDSEDATTERLRQSTLQQSPMRVSKTRSPSRRSGGEEKAKIRKTSSRVASANHATSLNGQTVKSR